MINHSPRFSVHIPRQWLPNCFGPCPTVNSQHYLHAINHHYSQTFSWTPRKMWLCVPAVRHAFAGHHLGHSPAKKQVYMYRPQYSQNQVSPHHIRRRSETQENFCLPVSPRWRSGINKKPNVQMSSMILFFSACWKINDKMLLLAQGMVQNIGNHLVEGVHQDSNTGVDVCGRHVKGTCLYTFFISPCMHAEELMQHVYLCSQQEAPEGAGLSCTPHHLDEALSASQCWP